MRAAGGERGHTLYGNDADITFLVLALIALTCVMLGVAYTIYINKIHEKEIATKIQKNLSIGLTVFAGLAGGVIGVAQIIVCTSVPKSLVWMIVGGFLNFVTGLPIYLSFRKGIVYGVQ